MIVVVVLVVVVVMVLTLGDGGGDKVRDFFDGCCFSLAASSIDLFTDEFLTVVVRVAVSIIKKSLVKYRL